MIINYHWEIPNGSIDAKNLVGDMPPEIIDKLTFGEVMRYMELTGETYGDSLSYMGDDWGMLDWSESALVFTGPDGEEYRKVDKKRNHKQHELQSMREQLTRMLEEIERQMDVS